MKKSDFLRRNVPLIVFACLLVVLILCPIAMIFAKAVMVNDRLDLSLAWQTVADSENLRTICNSILLGVAVVVLSTLIAAPLAFFMARTQLAQCRWLDIVLLIPFMTPPYISSMGWILFMQKRGIFQQLFPATGQFSEGFFSFFGLVLVMSLHVFPFLLTMLKNALLNVSTSLEESGAVFGGGFVYRMRRILLPLLSGNYAIGALLVFVKTLSEYGTPATLGQRIGFYVFTTDIHRYATTAPVSFGKAASLSSVLVLLCLGMWLLQNHITTKRSYRLVGGKGSRHNVHRLSSLKYSLVWCYVGAVLFLSIGIPYFSVIATSLIKLRGYGLAAGNFTFGHYIDLFTLNPKGVQALFTSLFLAAVSATIAAVLGTLLVTVLRNSKSRARKLVEAAGLLPEMLPSIVLVLGMMLFWNSVYQLVPLYNTLGMMVLAYVVLFLPYTIQYVTSSYTQMNDTLLQAGRTLGGSPQYVFRHITLPLIFKGVVTGWIMTFIISFRELVTASLIAPPNTLVVSTFIMREFEQGSVSVGMAMAVICVLLTTTALLVLNSAMNRRKDML